MHADFPPHEVALHHTLRSVTHEVWIEIVSTNISTLFTYTVQMQVVGSSETLVTQRPKLKAKYFLMKLQLLQKLSPTRIAPKELRMYRHCYCSCRLVVLRWEKLHSEVLIICTLLISATVV